MTTLDQAREALEVLARRIDNDGTPSQIGAPEEIREIAAALSAIEADGGADDSHAFKNFHRLLCERFDYTHDEKDWRRDQVSLIEWIARRAPLSASVPEGVEPVAWRARRQASNGEWLFWQDVAEDTALHYASQTRTDIQIERLYSEDAITRIAAERDEARAKLFPYADEKQISGMSWNGFYLIGDEKSIKELRRLENRSSQIEVFRAAFDERVAAEKARTEAAEAEVSLLRERLEKAGEVIREAISKAEYKPGDYPIVPVKVHEAVEILRRWTEEK